MARARAVDGGGMKINYRKEARGRDCQIRIPGVCSGDPSTVVLCHLPGGGVARKRDDRLGAWGCHSCHDAVDARTKCAFDATTLRLWHMEAVFRTQEALIAEGKL